MLPLEGITVVSLEQAIAAPFATRHLADLGARVIKVERPGTGDFARGYDATVHGQSSHFVWVNRSKESLTLDLKQPAAAAILQSLLDRADVFVQNLSPGAVDRLGFGNESLQARNPELVICAISGYGAGGTYETKKAYDLLIQAESGLLSVTGNGDAPAKVGVSIADISAGMYAYSNILAALLERHQTGRGRVIEVSMLEALGEWMGYPFYYSRYGGQAPGRNGAQHATIAPYGPFSTGDGKQIVMGIQNEREWARFCSEVLGDAELAQDPRFSSNVRRVENTAALDALINDAFQAYNLDELELLLEQQQIASARMRDMQAFAEHPQLQARGRWTSMAMPGGTTVDALLPPGCADESDCVMGPPPALGEHNTTILEELGYAREDIDNLIEQKVI